MDTTTQTPGTGQPEVDQFERAKSLAEQLEKVSILTIDTEDQAKLATAWSGQAKVCAEALETIRDGALAPHEAKITSIKSEHNASISPLRNGIKNFKKLLDAYAARKLIAQEAEAEARNRAAQEEATQSAANKEADAAALRQVANTKAAIGDAAGARQATRQAETIQAEASAIVTRATDVPVAAPSNKIEPIRTMAGTTTAQGFWDYEVLNVAELPVDLVVRTADKAAIKKKLKEQARWAHDEIPGLRIFRNAKSQTRT